MANLDQIERQIRELSTEEIDQLLKDAKSIRKEVEEKEGRAKAERWKKEINIDDKIQFRRAGKVLAGTVDSIQRDGIKVYAEGGKRARTIKWHEIMGKK